jgi:hypothetical protein
MLKLHVSLKFRTFIRRKHYMSDFATIDSGAMKEVVGRLERLSKSWAAGYQGMQNAGKTGIAALAAEQLDPVMRSITLEDKDFMISKDIPTLKATQSVYNYTVKTAVRSGVDLAGFEAFLPQEDTSQYIRVAEILKVYGIRKSITQMAQFINEAGGYSVDVEKENDINAALAMAESMERDLYIGGDYFIDANGDVDSLIAANVNGPIRNIRGIQANVREGDAGMRGIPGDFIGYGNNRSVVFDRKGSVLDRSFLDKVVTAVRDSRGMVKEAHCTTSQLAEFRATFFPAERGDLGALYAIRGAGITNDEQASLPIQTCAGVIDFIPTVFKYMRVRPEPVVGSVGVPPSTPTTLTVTENVGAATNSGFTTGDVYGYVVQAVNISGISVACAQVAVTCAANNKAIDLTWARVAGAEYYMVFRTPKESSGLAGTEMFIGKKVQSNAGTITFKDNGKVVPGLDSVMFLPRDKNRAKLAVLGNLLNKLSLGVRGLAFETVYASYFGCVVDRPRSFAVSDNVYQQREGI